MTHQSSRANHFELTDEQLKITYDETTFNGQPQVTYQEEPGEEPRVFRGEEVRVRNSELGSQVTVTLESIPDSETILLTLFIPEIYLRNVSEYRFETIAIETTVRNSFAGPKGVQGAIQNYAVWDLDGMAQIVTS